MGYDKASIFPAMVFYTNRGYYHINRTSGSSAAMVLSFPVSIKIKSCKNYRLHPETIVVWVIK